MLHVARARSTESMAQTLAARQGFDFSCPIVTFDADIEPAMSQPDGDAEPSAPSAAGTRRRSSSAWGRPPPAKRRKGGRGRGRGKPAEEEETVVLGERIERDSERLRVGPRPVRLSQEDKAAAVAVDEGGLVASHSGGYSMVSQLMRPQCCSSACRWVAVCLAACQPCRACFEQLSPGPASQPPPNRRPRPGLCSARRLRLWTQGACSSAYLPC